MASSPKLAITVTVYRYHGIRAIRFFWRLRIGILAVTDTRQVAPDVRHLNDGEPLVAANKHDALGIDGRNLGIDQAGHRAQLRCQHGEFEVSDRCGSFRSSKSRQ